MTLGERLRSLRGERTLSVIAAETGLSVSYLSDLEHDRTDPSLRTLAKFARVYEMSVIALVATVDEYNGPMGDDDDGLPFDTVSAE